MLINLAGLMFLAFGFAKGFQKLRLPPLLGMLLVGLTFGRYSPELWIDGMAMPWLSQLAISPETLALSADFRTLALVVILLRAGLGVRKADLVAVGRPAFLLSWLPALLEGIALTLALYHFLGWGWKPAGLLACVLSAVSPAVIVPKMLSLIQGGWGMKRKVPIMILAGASMDDLLAITGFGLLLNDMMGLGGGLTLLSNPWLDGPLNVLLGVVLGAVGGAILARAVLWCDPRLKKLKDLEKTIFILCVMLVYYGTKDHFLLPICTLLGIMFFGFMILEKSPTLANALSHCFNQIWIGAECLLFLMIGAEVDPRLIWTAGLMGIGILALGLLARSLGVLASLWKTDLDFKERAFCVMAYWPKATVQAAIGGVALSAVQAGTLTLAGGLEMANSMLAMAVLGILITAPLGALTMEWFSESLLKPVALDRD